MNILDNIIRNKRKEVDIRKNLFSTASLEASEWFVSKRPSFLEAIASEGPSIIGEFKRRSPSKGIINRLAEIEDVARAYESAGVKAMSILTDLEFFGGEAMDLQKVAGFSKIPLLRKDFIIDEYQIIESKSIGASAILLIAAVLTKREIRNFTGLAGSLGLDILCEIHDLPELKKLDRRNNILGINNRNLKTFSIDIDLSRELVRQLPADSLKVAESGLSNAQEVRLLYEAGFDAFLIGESFMKAPDPGKAAEELIKGLKMETG